jgi:hypothetical protein
MGFCQSYLATTEVIHGKKTGSKISSAEEIQHQKVAWRCGVENEKPNGEPSEIINTHINDNQASGGCARKKANCPPARDEDSTRDLCKNAS